MADNKKSFLLYCDLIHTVEKMPNEKAGELIKHILRYVNDQNPETEDLIIQLSFEPVKQQLKRDLVKYQTIKDKNSESARMRWHAKAQSALPNDAKHADSDTVNDTDTDSDTVKEKKKRNKRAPIFVPPVFEEFEKYCFDNGFKCIAKRAFAGYAENNWHDAKNNQIVSWKSKLQNGWFRDENKDFVKTESKIVTLPKPSHYTNPKAYYETCMERKVIPVHYWSEKPLTEQEIAEEHLKFNVGIYA